MFKKSFITDCEGPLTLNDNAFELSDYFIENGDELFKILSLYDDYLADVVKKPNYKSGNTLKLILPFFMAENLKNKDLISFSQNNISLVNDSNFLINYLKESMNTYIVSTSYGQYIEAVANYMDLPFENTYYTKVDIDIDFEDTEKIKGYKKLILANPDDYELFNKIFFEEMVELSFYDKIKDVEVIGGLGKKLAIDDIIARDNIDVNEILYIGDSITDVEPLNFARENNGISISFNGNEYPLKVAEIAIVSPSAVATAVIANIYSSHDKNTVLEFIKEYNSSRNFKELFNKFGIDENIKNRFFILFEKGNYPIIKIITDENFDEILKESSKMRNEIRGLDIGNLG